MFSSFKKCQLLEGANGSFVKVPGLLRTEYMVLLATSDMEDVDSSVFINTLENAEISQIAYKNSMSPRQGSWADKSGLTLLMFTCWNKECEKVEKAIMQYQYRVLFKVHDYKFWCDEILGHIFEISKGEEE